MKGPSLVKRVPNFAESALMRLKVRFTVFLNCWAFFGLSAAAQTEITPAAQVQLQESPTRQRPGEYPDYLFREHFPAPVTETSEDFQENTCSATGWARAPNLTVWESNR